MNLDRLIRQACRAVSSVLRCRTIECAPGSPYMHRFSIFKTPAGPRWCPRIYLHHIVSSDLDQELHSHPFSCISIILAGGYIEERRHRDEDGFHVVERAFTPGWLNVIRTDTFHRVDLLDGDSWSLALVGPRTKSWSFWCRESERVWPWREFLKEKGMRVET